MESSRYCIDITEISDNPAHLLKYLEKEESVLADKINLLSFNRYDKEEKKRPNITEDEYYDKIVGIGNELLLNPKKLNSQIEVEYKITD
mmetsp:Transcript_20546/g.18186  ORF Transcript_20546/g.18186 Transcript_20546/m.18186 type:complete len:89 (+) Transcript_20546:336-602(+)